MPPSAIIWPRTGRTGTGACSFARELAGARPGGQHDSNRQKNTWSRERTPVMRPPLVLKPVTGDPLRTSAPCATAARSSASDSNWLLTPASDDEKTPASTRGLSRGSSSRQVAPSSQSMA